MAWPLMGHWVKMVSFFFKKEATIAIKHLKIRMAALNGSSILESWVSTSREPTSGAFMTALLGSISYCFFIFVSYNPWSSLWHSCEDVYVILGLDVKMMWIVVADASLFSQCLSFFISTAGKRVFWTGRAVVGISAYYDFSVHHIE